MKRYKLKALIKLMIILIFLYVSIQSEYILIDHTCTKLADIPATAIIAAKEQLHIVYGHTSHGSHITNGMTDLIGQTNLHGYKGDIYEYNYGGLNDALDLRDHNGWHIDQGGPMIPGGAKDLGEENWDIDTRTYLSDNPEINVVMWGWCGQVSLFNNTKIKVYLSKMNQLEEEYPNVKFVYMTGHLDGFGLNSRLHTNNDTIRAFCKRNDKILYDFADIESYDPDGVYYGDKFATDGCNYDYNGDGKTDQSGDPALPENGDRNWAIDWQNSHVEGVDWYRMDHCSHSQHLNGNMKAYAGWWLWARLAQWDNTPVIKPKQHNKFTFNLHKGNSKIVLNSLLKSGSKIKLYSINGKLFFSNIDQKSSSIDFLKSLKLSKGSYLLSVKSLASSVYKNYKFIIN